HAANEHAPRSAQTTRTVIKPARMVDPAVKSSGAPLQGTCPTGDRGRSREVDAACAVTSQRMRTRDARCEPRSAQNVFFASRKRANTSSSVEASPRAAAKARTAELDHRRNGF